MVAELGEWVVAFVSGGGLTALAVAAREWLKQRRRQLTLSNEKTLAEVLRDAHDMQMLLEKVRDALGAVRVVLLFAHDSGGPITAATPIYSSIVREAHRDGVVRRINRWTDQVVDGQYLQLLRDIVESGSRLLVTREMPDGDLKRVYLSDNVTCGLVKLVDADFDGLTSIWYLSAVFDQPDPPTAAQRDEVRNLVSQMRSYMRKRP